MCYFVTVAVPAKRESALGHFRDAGYALRSCANRQLAAAFPGGFKLFEVTHGGCSCGLYAAAIQRPTEEGVRAKYAKKGWSPARIERAVASKRHSGRLGDGTPLFKAFLEAVRGAATDAKRLVLFAHWYSGGTDSEVFGSLDSSAFSVAEFIESGGVYPHDTIVDIRL